MSTLLPAKIERVWLVDACGSAVEKKGAPKKLTSGQRHYLYRLGLMAVDQFLKQRGFRSNTDASSTTFSYEKSGCWIDIKLTSPENIAYVTSYPGYEYKQESIGKTADGQARYGVRAKVVTAKEIMGSDLLIQVMLSTADSVGTRKPIFVPLPPDLPNPAQHVLKQVLGTIALACEQIPKLRSAFSEAEVVAAQEQAIDISTVPLLPD